MLPFWDGTRPSGSSYANDVDVGSPWPKIGMVHVPVPDAFRGHPELHRESSSSNSMVACPFVVWNYWWHDCTSTWCRNADPEEPSRTRPHHCGWMTRSSVSTRYATLWELPFSYSMLLMSPYLWMILVEPSPDDRHTWPAWPNHVPLALDVSDHHRHPRSLGRVALVSSSSSSMAVSWWPPKMRT